MKIFDEFVARALVGAQRQAGGLPSLPEALAGLLDSTGPFEKTLLDAAAACTVYAVCGVATTPAIDQSPVCPPDEMEECSSKAAEVLGQLLTANLDSVLMEWLQAAAVARRRPPHILLPALLDRAAARRELRELVHQVVDSRGAWLATMNSQWQFAKPVPGVSESAWQTGTRDERLVALRLARESDAELGRRLVQNTWSTDPADDRVRWIGGLAMNLSMDDEPFLESCLDDRSIRVREAAAALLARMPASQLVARMTSRIRPLFGFTPASAGSVLKLQKKQPASLTVSLPDAFDKAMLRDGMVEKPVDNIGPRQWWLTQMVACVPPSYWSTCFETSAAELVDGLESDFADAVVTGWRIAASRHTDPSWAVALTHCPAGRDRWSGSYITAIPESERPGIVAQLPKQPDGGFDLGALLAAWSPPGVQVSRAVISRFGPEQLLHSGAASRLHPDALADLEPMLSELSNQPYVGRLASQALTTIAFRRVIATEFVA